MLGACRCVRRGAGRGSHHRRLAAAWRRPTIDAGGRAGLIRRRADRDARMVDYHRRPRAPQPGWAAPARGAGDGRRARREEASAVAHRDVLQLLRRHRRAAAAEDVLPRLLRPGARADHRLGRVPARHRVVRRDPLVHLPPARLAVPGRGADHGDHGALRAALAARRDHVALRPQGALPAAALRAARDVLPLHAAGALPGHRRAARRLRALLHERQPQAGRRRAAARGRQEGRPGERGRRGERQQKTRRPQAARHRDLLAAG
mmetsp:Transcript_18134/g.43077  ORF Transcript_18134/g.43077 Transcript_18134/m.43077 type:complete len:262 (-) Transcript_18134:247-1032(-)